MQRRYRFLMCHFLIACAAVAAPAAAPAAANSLDDLAIGAGPERGAAGAHGFPYGAGAVQGVDDPDVLDGLIDPAPDWDSTDAAVPGGVSRIAATACKAGMCHAARPDPVPAAPEPSALALLGAGLALLGWRRRQAWSFTPLAPRCPG